MFREQQIMNNIVNELGEEFNEFIETFNGYDLWLIREGELLVNKSFKRILEVIAGYNLTTADQLLESAYDLPMLESSEKMFAVYDNLTRLFLDNGGTNVLIRSVIFCYMIYKISKIETELSPIEILKDASESVLLKKEDSLWYKFKHLLGLREQPFKVKGDIRSLSLMSILSGKSIHQTNYDVAEYKDFI